MKTRLKLSKGRVDISSPDRKKHKAEMQALSLQNVSKLSQKYGKPKYHV